MRPALVLAVVLAALFPAPVHSNGTRINIAVFVEYVEVDKAQVAKLLTGYEASADASGLREKLSKDKRAKLVESSYLLTRSGQRAEVHSNLELRFPVEGDPPELPQALAGPIAKEVDPVTWRGVTSLQANRFGFLLQVDAVVGRTLDIIEVDISMEATRLLKSKEIGKKRSALEMPERRTKRLSTGLTIKSGKPVIIGVHTPVGTNKKPKKNRRVIVFLSATAMVASE